MERSHRVSVAAVATTAVLALAACGSAADTTPSGSSTPPAAITAPPTPSSSPTPAASPAPDNDGITMPTCDQIMDAAATTAMFGEGVEPITGEVAVSPDVFPGPAAREAYAQAVRSITCTWGYPNSDGGFQMVIAELPQQATEDFSAELDGSADFTQTSVSGVPAYGMDYDTAIGQMSVTYAIDGISVYAVVSSLFDASGAAPMIQRGLDAVQAANPSAE